MFHDITRDDVFVLETRRLWLRWPTARDAHHLAGFVPDARERVLAWREANETGLSLALALDRKTKPGQPIGLALAEPGRDGRRVLVRLHLDPDVGGDAYDREALGVLARAILAFHDAEWVEAIGPDGGEAGLRLGRADITARGPAPFSGFDAPHPPREAVNLQATTVIQGGGP